MANDRGYLSCAETAKLIRAALKESFPGVKFSVRSSVYSGGASIDVRYLDGPAVKQVEAVAGAFAGSYFDGMIDYKGSVYHTLDGRPVQFLADFVFVGRDYSDEVVASVMAMVADENGIEGSPTVADYRRGNLYGVKFKGSGFRPDDFGRLVNIALAGNSSVPNALPSPTLARIEFSGSDEYGAPYGTNGYPSSGRVSALRQTPVSAVSIEGEQ